ncbi:DUF4386 family protein [Wenzhouxiangella marina]|uniref:Membrane protein n=1 Tax=Wenzhouxiangella marina TaxID=1579979 RepID=A0A0K0XRU7_9GAMM|nr:DUF4386 family protein [Wenzhouxiangella marina]AKS40418.1 membrane protein [Wenzhouxiangella marina]MBB6088260.1 hypothetical protein [Wenzhouxiangella marina]
MKTLSRAGACAALTQAFCYLFGFALLVTVMDSGNVEGWSALQKLEYLLEREALFQLWNLVIYVVFGVALVILTAALHHRLAPTDPPLMSVATPFGYIWSGLVIASGMVASVGLSAVSEMQATDPDGAAQLWSTLGVIQSGLGGGVEIVGGLWVLLLSVSSLRRGQGFPVMLTWLGVLVGLAGLATIVPAWSALGAVFGMTQIVWFIWVGITLFRAPS